MTTIKEIQALYDQGKTEEVFRESEEFLSGVRTTEEVKEIWALRAWAYYRRKEYVEAEEAASKAGDNEVAIRCRAAIAAYHHKNSELMRFWLDKLPESPARDNTFVIYAREPSDTTSEKDILARALRWATPNPDDMTNTANLFNNTARWYLAKAPPKLNDSEIPDRQVVAVVIRRYYFLEALDFMRRAIRLYGKESKNLHHRASAWYWTSVIQEKLLGKSAAVSAAEMSVNLWKKQLKVDPSNPHFQKSLEGAKTRLKELRKT